jgi:ABC-type phosphate transport system substrate-binding protein
MLKLTRLMTTVATVASLAAFAAGTAGVAVAAPAASSAPAKTAAPADPPKGTTPQSYDVVGVGSNTTENVLDQLSVNYNATIPAKKHSATDPYFYSYDALPAGVAVAPTPDPYKITPKAGCSSIGRPNGSGAGLTALDENTFDGKTGHYCIDFARSSSGRSASAPKLGSGGVEYAAFARDAVDWSVRAPKHGGSDAPSSLTLTQLKGIFSCRTTNWDQVGGKNAKIKVYLPQAGSGTLSFWLGVMGLSAVDGSCTSQAPEENEGTYAGFNSPNAIFIFSVGSYLAQEYRSMACTAKAPAKGQNEFGCNETGVLALQKISGVLPVTTNTSAAVTNPKFPSQFYRTLYNILRYTTETKDHIYQRLEPFFSKTGYLCTNKTAQADIKAYGFVVTPACGSLS